MKIAIVEDDINMRKSLEISMSDYPEFKLKSFKNAKDALAKLDDTFDLIVTDINMPGMNGIEFVKELDGRYEVIIMTGNATLQSAIDSIKMGVKDFLLKPFEIETLVKAIKRSSQVQKASLNPKNATDAPHGFKATSPRLEKVIKIASKAAVTDASIMLLGESGVGKEVFANFVHDHSTRKEKPFVAINMAAIPENLLESELFGYEKGAFTDAVTSKVGHFEAANGGTIFLDEIAEMPYPLQAKLLRALQEKEIRRLGGQKSIKLDIRVISATNANLEQAISDGEFREDLFYRLNTIPINIPPLRQRVEEIIPLATHILSEQCERYGMEHKQFNAEAHDELESYNWPGNIRELISVIERAVILSESNDISAEDLFLEGRKKKKSIASMEKDLILEILDETEHDLDASAKMLGITLANFKKKLKKFEIEVEE